MSCIQTILRKRNYLICFALRHVHRDRLVPSFLVEGWGLAVVVSRAVGDIGESIGVLTARVLHGVHIAGEYALQGRCHPIFRVRCHLEFHMGSVVRQELLTA